MYFLSDRVKALYSCGKYKASSRLSGFLSLRGVGAQASVHQFVPFTEHNHVFAHAQECDFWTGGRKFKHERINIELSQIRLHCPQSTLALS